MRNSTKTELRTLREVAHFLLPLVCCEFCRLPLLDPKLADKVFGDKAHTPLKFLKLTTHHRNGKHRDNRGSKVGIGRDLAGNLQVSSSGILAICGNKSLTHCDCHRRHEMKLNHHKRKVMKVKPLRERAKYLLDKLSRVSLISAPDNFYQKMCKKYDREGKFTRYEIRRLKKLAVKVEEKK